MVSRGKKKRGVGVMGLRRVRNPIQLAREMLVRGERDLEGGNGEHRGPMGAQAAPPPGGAQGHSQIFGEAAEELARLWGVETVPDQSYFFTQKRWDEHVAGLERERRGGSAGYDGGENVSQGTCGAVALDSEGVCCVATSTGGMTNKLTGRIGDTPTLGAGFWAEEWMETVTGASAVSGRNEGPVFGLSDGLRGLVADCLPGLGLHGAPRYEPVRTGKGRWGGQAKTITRATAISGTGNGDSFLRLNAVRTVSAIARYAGRGRSCDRPSLREAMREITGPGGELEKSAGERWRKTGEGEGGMIGIECVIVRCGGEVSEVRTEVVQDYNCGGMFRAWVDEEGKAVCRVWREDQELPDGYEREGKRWDLSDWYKELS